MKRGVIFVLFTAIISGCAIFINQFGVKGINSTLFTFTKNIIVSLFLISIILLFKEFNNLRKLNKKEWLSLVFVGLIGGAIPFVLFFRGLQLSTGVIGSLIHKTMFIFVAVMAMMFLKERLNKKILIPAVLLLGGNFMLLRMNSFELSVGSLMIFIATLFWASENVISKNLLKTIEPKVLAFGRLFFGSLFIMTYMFIAGIPFSLGIGQFSWILVTVPFLLLYVITWYTGLKYVKVTTATSVLLLGSPITTLLSVFFLGKTLVLSQAFGILFIVVGIISMISLTERRSYSVIESYKT